MSNALYVTIIALLAVSLGKQLHLFILSLSKSLYYKVLSGDEWSPAQYWHLMRRWAALAVSERPLLHSMHLHEFHQRADPGRNKHCSKPQFSSSVRSVPNLFH